MAELGQDPKLIAEVEAEVKAEDQPFTGSPPAKAVEQLPEEHKSFLYWLWEFITGKTTITTQDIDETANTLGIPEWKERGKTLVAILTVFLVVYAFLYGLQTLAHIMNPFNWFKWLLELAYYLQATSAVRFAMKSIVSLFLTASQYKEVIGMLAVAGTAWHFRMH